MTIRNKFELYRIDASDRPKVLYEYRVSGKGVFPLDMLRYDAAYPAGDFHQGLDVRERSITLRSYLPPTIARWKSFGWIVT